MNGNDSLKMYAENYTKRIENQKYTTDNHDVGLCCIVALVMDYA